jgi:putative transposase
MRTKRIRLYPTHEQEEKMWAHVHAARAIWNVMLSVEECLYEFGSKHLNAFGLNNLLKDMKKTEKYMWLNEVSNTTLKGVNADLDDAYSRFFKKIARHPRFKARDKADPKFPVRADALYFKDGTANIEKIGKVLYKTNLDIPGGKEQKLRNPRIKFDNGKWILSFAIECESQARELNDKAMGIDLGIKDLATVSYGGEKIVIHNINKSRKMRRLDRKLRHETRNLSRTKKCSKNRNKARQKLRKLYGHIANIRQDYIHKNTHELAELLPFRITMEDLNVSGMMKDHHKAKGIQDAKWADFLRQMQYKCEDRGIEFYQVSRWYPSSKTCSCCGNVKRDLKLNDRVYKCEVCGLEIDRDYNAALNLERYTSHNTGLVA